MVSSSSFELLVNKGQVEFSTKGGEKRKVGANQRLFFRIGEPLSEPVELNLVESETFFGTGNFNFNRR